VNKPTLFNQHTTCFCIKLDLPINILAMSKEKKSNKEAKKAPAENVMKKQSSYQTGKTSVSADLNSKKSK
jgi:hypothetical protein